MQEISYDYSFNYPLNIDIRPVVSQMLNGEEAAIKPINIYPYKYIINKKKCDISHLVILVKSARKNFKRRIAIRRTWGSETRFSNVTIKVAFFLGIGDDDLQSKIEKEASVYNDIVQSDFFDTYFNNTIKTVQSLKWAFKYCPKSKYYLFSDDDMYISVLNLFKYIKSLDFDPVYSGYVFNSAPHRHYLSKWQVKLEEYPYDRWPPYVTAGAYLLSKTSLKLLYLGSLYTKHFRFDDIYLGLVAKKVGVTPKHCSNFFFYKKPYRGSNYEHVIASHGYGREYELLSVWNEQKSLGFA